MNNRFLIATTIFVGFSTILLFALSVSLGLAGSLPFETRLWAGHESANSQSQMMWILAIAAGCVYVWLARLLGVFDRLRLKIGPLLAAMVSGAPLDRLIIFVMVLIVVLGAGSCVASVGVQVYDRYVDPSCFYRSPC